MQNPRQLTRIFAISSTFDEDICRAANQRRGLIPRFHARKNGHVVSRRDRLSFFVLDFVFAEQRQLFVDKTPGHRIGVYPRTRRFRNRVRKTSTNQIQEGHFPLNRARSHTMRTTNRAFAGTFRIVRHVSAPSAGAFRLARHANTPPAGESRPTNRTPSPPHTNT